MAGINVLAPTAMTEQERISQFIATAFRAWQSGGVDFLVLRNYDRLPNAVSNDIDVLVSAQHARRAEEILRTAARQTGFRLHNRAEYSTLALYFSADTGAQVHFDLFTALKWRGFHFLKTDRYLAKKIDKGLFSIPHSAHEAATNLLATMIYTGRVKEKYKPSIAGGFKTKKTRPSVCLRKPTGKDRLNSSSKAGANERWVELERATASLRRSLISRQILRQPLGTIGSLLGNTARILKRYIHPPGLCVVLCGADGSGKSTVATGLATALSGSFSPEKGRHFHWKPPVFSGARQASRGPGGQAAREAAPKPGDLAALFCGALDRILCRLAFANPASDISRGVGFDRPVLL